MGDDDARATRYAKMDTMAPVTPKTTLAELQARVRSAAARGVDQSARLIRSVQQSLRVEGYEVREEVLRDALAHVRYQPPR